MSNAFIKGVTSIYPTPASPSTSSNHRPRLKGRGSDPPPRTENRSQPQGPALGAPQGSSASSESQRADLDAFVSQATTKRTARAWLYREQLREILDRKQINVVSAMLKRWCANVMRSKVEAMKKVAEMILEHFEGVTAWAQTRQTNGFLEAINGLFQAAKRKARGYGRFKTMRIVVYPVAGNLNFSAINPHAKL